MYFYVFFIFIMYFLRLQSLPLTISSIMIEVNTNLQVNNGCQRLITRWRTKYQRKQKKENITEQANLKYLSYDEA